MYYYTTIYVTWTCIGLYYFFIKKKIIFQCFNCNFNNDDNVLQWTSMYFVHKVRWTNKEFDKIHLKMSTKRLLEINIVITPLIQRYKGRDSLLYISIGMSIAATSREDVSHSSWIELIIFLNGEKIYLYMRTIVVERMTQVRARSLLLSCENHLKIARRAIYAAISAGKWDDGVSSSFLTRFYHFTVRRKIGNKRRSEKRLMVILQQHLDQHSNQITYDYMQIHTWSTVLSFLHSAILCKDSMCIKIFVQVLLRAVICVVVCDRSYLHYFLWYLYLECSK